MPLPKKYTKRPTATPVHRDENACVFCNVSENNEEKYGKFLSTEHAKVHYFCMLFASGLSQNGESDEVGILGFLEDDIRKELRRAHKMVCKFCDQPGASVGCSVKSCKTVFHLGCGMSHNVLFQYFGSFNAYCIDHRPMQKPLPKSQRGSPTPECPICRCDVPLKPSLDTLRGPCCTKQWYHRDCIQRQARSAGLHFFRCPLCNAEDTQEEFQEEMERMGIHIPDQDAAWETEPHAFEDLLERYNHCDAETCQCPQGREFDEPDKGWNLLVCCTCSSQGAHAACIGLKTRNPDHEWTCRECRKIVGNASKKAASPRMKIPGKAERSPYKFTYLPKGQGRKRKRTTSSWAKGQVKRASKKLRVSAGSSPWKSSRTVALRGGKSACGASPKSSINCTNACENGEHKPRIPQLRLYCSETNAKASTSTADTTMKSSSGPEPSCSTPLLPLKANSFKINLRGPPMSPVLTRKTPNKSTIAEVDYATLTAALSFNANKTVDLISSDESGVESVDSKTDTSSLDSDVRRAAMELCVIEKATPDKYMDEEVTICEEKSSPAKRVQLSISGDITSDKSSNDDCTMDAKDTSAETKDWSKMFSFGKKCEKDSLQKRSYKPRMKAVKTEQGQKTLFNYFAPVKTCSEIEKPEKRRPRPVMSVKPTRKESSTDEETAPVIASTKSSLIKSRSPIRPLGAYRKMTARKSITTMRVEELKSTSLVVLSDGSDVEIAKIGPKSSKSSPAISRVKKFSPRKRSRSPRRSSSKLGIESPIKNKVHDEVMKTLSPPNASPRVTSKTKDVTPAASQSSADNCALVLSDSENEDMDVSHSEIVKLFRAVDNPPEMTSSPRRQQRSRSEPDPRRRVVASDSASDSTSSDHDSEIIVGRTKRRVIQPDEFRHFDKKSAKFLRHLLKDTTTPLQESKNLSDISSSSSSASGLFDLKNLKTVRSSSSDDGLFDLKNVSGFEPVVKTEQNLSDQENSGSNTRHTQRRKKLRLKRKRSDVTRAPSNDRSSSSSVESTSRHRLPLSDVDKARPIGIIEPTWQAR